MSEKTGTGRPAAVPVPAVAARVAAIASFGAAVIHARGAIPHAEEDPIYGAFFWAFAAAQAAVGLLLAVTATRPSRPVAVTAVVVHEFVIGAWVMTRVVGPPIGADAWLTEPVEFADLVAVGLQCLAIAAVLLAVLVGRDRVLRRVVARPVLGAMLIATVPLVALADPDTHSALCQDHADEPDVGPLAAAYGHSMLEPGGAPVELAVGDRVTVLAGWLINCDNHPVEVSGAEVVNGIGGVTVEEFLVGRLDGTGGFDRFGHDGIEVPATGDEATLGLFTVLRARAPGRFGIHAVHIEVGDHHDAPVTQAFATVVNGQVLSR